MEKVIGSKGSIVSWHKSFEITLNKEMADLYPYKSYFLNNINIRMIDLEDIFKNGYVDIQFGGSTSIKKFYLSLQIYHTKTLMFQIVLMQWEL